MGETHQRVTLTREQLYQRVWETPMRHLAKEYGLSDVGLAKVCKKHKIPCPGLGYWAKRRHGKAPRQAPLPKCADLGHQTITFYLGGAEPLTEADGEQEPGEPKERFDDDVEDWLERAAALPRIKMPKSLHAPHSLIDATQRSLRSTKPDHRYGLVYSRWDERRKTVDIAVSPKNVDRALRCMNALIRAVERLGGQIVTEKQRWGRSRTIVYLADERVATIRIRELCRQRVIEPDPDDDWPYRRYEHSPTGELVLDEGQTGYRAHCRDSKRAPIEKQLNTVIISWVRKLGRDRIWRCEREEEQRIRREQALERQRIREDFERRQSEEQDRVDKLLADTSGWHQSRIIREYVDVVRQQALGNGGIEDRGELERWIAWALQHADRVDPLTPSPPSVLDKESPE